MNIKSIILFVIIAGLNTIAFGQDSKEDKKNTKNYEIHGFIKTDFWYDTRKVADAREGIFNLFPLDKDLNSIGEDLNAVPSFNYSAITSRINFKYNGIKAFGANTYGFIEGGFSGASNDNVNTFRLRHAYLNMDWKKSSLLLGQYWHPMFVTAVFPRVASLNTGSPFQPFNRSPQIRFTRKFNDLKLIAAVLTQRDYVSKGPAGKSYKYLSYSNIPNSHLQLQYSKKKSTAGIAVDHKILMPRIVTDSNFATNTSISSISYMAYYKWKSENFEIKTKAIWGENLTDNLLLGGYAVATIDNVNDYRTYTPTQHLFLWSNFTYTKRFKKFNLMPGLFLGYAENFGTKENNVGIYYGTGNNIDKLYRISPSITFMSGKTIFFLEWEHTEALYGKNIANGLVKNTHSVSNNRFLLTVLYLF